MSETWAPLAEQIFGKPFADVSVVELQQAAAQYPYVGPLQLLLLCRLEPGTEAYAAQYNRSILHFPTPAHLHFALHQQPDVLQTKPTVSSQKNEVAEPAQTREHTITTAGSSEDLLPGKQASEVHKDHLAPQSIAEPATESSVPESSIATSPVASALAIAENILPPADAVSAQPKRIEAEQTEAAVPTEKEQQLATPVEELSFEPFHTVDYFASQGIKLSREEVGTDKFGKQLKSFTEWLKTMKRLPAAQAAPTDGQADKGVNKMAEQSLAEAAVLTESMAAVWEKQGAFDKAREVYNKLSLLHPSKRAYFAAKIEALNGKK